MNTFTIYKNNSMVFNRIFNNPPSLEDKNILIVVLGKYEFSSLEYRIDIIHGNNCHKLTGCFYSIDEFIHYFIDLTKDGVKYGVVLYL